MQKARQSELILIVFFSVFGAAWAFFVVPYLTSSAWFIGLDPLSAYLLYNLGWFLLTTFLFGGLVAYLAFGKIRIADMLKVGVSTWLFVSLVFDNFQPPFYMSSAGQVLIPVGTAALENEAVDAMLAYVWGFIVPNVQVNINLELVSAVVVAVFGFLTLYFAKSNPRSHKSVLTASIFIGLGALTFVAFAVAGVPVDTSVSLLYIFVYPVSSFIAVVVMALLLAPKRFVSLFYSAI
jgi:hypothetical protein